MGMKFIVFKSLGCVTDVPILFPDYLNHRDVGEAFGGEKNIVSAGFVAISTDCDGVTVEVHGKSTDYPNKPPKSEDDFFLSNAVTKH
jgi:hypothetical protein